MNRTKLVCYLIAASQIILGLLYLFWPVGFVDWQGLSPIAPDISYPLAMLAARFLIYGFGMIAIAQRPEIYRIWLDGMIGIQLIDLLAGAFYVSVSVVSITDAMIPMANALAFVLLMFWIRPKNQDKLSHQLT